MSTLLAYKLGLTLAISLLAMTTYITSSACIAWVNQDNWHSFESCLVCNETTQLVERPTQSFCSLRLPYRCPFVDMRQVFQRYRPIGVFGFLNKMFTNTMIGVSTKASLMSASLFFNVLLALLVLLLCNSALCLCNLTRTCSTFSLEKTLPSLSTAMFFTPKSMPSTSSGSSGVSSGISQVAYRKNLPLRYTKSTCP